MNTNLTLKNYQQLFALSQELVTKLSLTPQSKIQYPYDEIQTLYAISADLLLYMKQLSDSNIIIPNINEIFEFIRQLCERGKEIVNNNLLSADLCVKISNMEFSFQQVKCQMKNAKGESVVTDENELELRFKSIFDTYYKSGDIETQIQLLSVFDECLDLYTETKNVSKKQLILKKLSEHKTNLLQFFSGSKDQERLSFYFERLAKYS
jgi:hypothetical protein